MYHFRSFIFGFAILVLVGAGCSNAPIKTPGSPSTTGDTSATQGTGRQAPAFALEDYDGNTVSLSDFEVKHIIINSWAAWCPFCREELPDLATIQEEFEDEDLVVIAVDRQETRKTAKAYSDELGVTGRIVLLVDPTDSFYRSIAGFSMPETIFVEPDGEIQFHKRGVMKIDELRNRTETLLAN